MCCACMRMLYVRCMNFVISITANKHTTTTTQLSLTIYNPKQKKGLHTPPDVLAYKSPLYNPFENIAKA